MSGFTAPVSCESVCRRTINSQLLPHPPPHAASTATGRTGTTLHHRYSHQELPSAVVPSIATAAAWPESHGGSANASDVPSRNDRSLLLSRSPLRQTREIRVEVNPPACVVADQRHSLHRKNTASRLRSCFSSRSNLNFATLQMSSGRLGVELRPVKAQRAEILLAEEQRLLAQELRGMVGSPGRLHPGEVAMTLVNN